MMDALLQRINQNALNIQASSIRAFDEHISKIDGMIKLTLGEPDFPTPDHVKQAGIVAIEGDESHYFPTPGSLKLRQAASHFLNNKYQLRYDANTEVIVTVGATEALFASLLTVLNPGDKVVVPSPFFGMYQSMIRLIGGEPILIDTSADNFILTAEKLEAAFAEHGDAIKAVLINYPSNPTGAIWTEEQAKAVAKVLEDRPVFVISDEVYSELVYEGKHVSLGHFLPEQTIVINGLSKSHAMTGWRVGLVFAKAPVMEQVTKVHQQLVTTATSISQEAAYEALQNGANDAEPMREAYQARRDFVYQTMTELGFTIAKPNGAFYIFARIPEDLEQDSYQFALDVAEHARVGFIPGSGFGPGGEHHVRLSYAASMDDLEEAMKRIKEYITSLR